MEEKSNDFGGNSHFENGYKLMLHEEKEKIHSIQVPTITISKEPSIVDRPPPPRLFASESRNTTQKNDVEPPMYPKRRTNDASNNFATNSHPFGAF